MSLHGHAEIDPRRPQALGRCDRCGAIYNHSRLRWQVQWTGPRLANLRLLVCPTCYDKPQEQLRTVVLPPDPVPIQNPRPEDYVNNNNPNSGIGQGPSTLVSNLPGSNIGTLTEGGGTASAFDGVTGKPLWRSAYLTAVAGTANNWVGMNWAASPVAVPSITGMSSTTPLAYSVASFTMTAPRDAPFLGSGAVAYQFDGSSDATTWTTLATGTSSGSNGESISVTVGGGQDYQYHRLAFNGDGVNRVAIAQLAINTANRGNLDQQF